MDAKKGFFLNGKPYPLHGVSRHQDRKGLGNAITREMHDEDMALIRELGAKMCIRDSLFCEAFGSEKTENLQVQYPCVDIYGCLLYTSDVYKRQHKDFIASYR